MEKKKPSLPALRFLLPAAAFLALAVFLLLGLDRNPDEIPSPLIDKPAPAWRLSRLAGTPSPVAPTPSPAADTGSTPGPRANGTATDSLAGNADTVGTADSGRPDGAARSDTSGSTGAATGVGQTGSTTASGPAPAASTILDAAQLRGQPSPSPPECRLH